MKYRLSSFRQQSDTEGSTKESKRKVLPRDRLQKRREERNLDIYIFFFLFYFDRMYVFVLLHWKEVDGSCSKIHSVADASWIGYLLHQEMHILLMTILCTAKIPSRSGQLLHLMQKSKKTKIHCGICYFFSMCPEQEGAHIFIGNFLKKLYTSHLECPRSYDKLRFDPSKPNCRLMVTHDDYSMMSKLPKERTSVVTILRNPVDRVFSTYEFSVEVAARFLVHPNLTSATQMTGRIRSKNGVSTLEIWPWKYLVPWMREDLFARRDARKRGSVSDIKERNDSYNMEAIVMPLHEFINDPVAHDIIHNGATFQVAGLTNNSYLFESHEVRHCVRKHHTLGEYVLEVAKKRLDDMLYVGLTEDHRESATMFANVVGSQVLSQLKALSSSIERAANNNSELTSAFPDSEPDSNHVHNSTTDEKASKVSLTENDEATNENMTVGELIDAYEVCTSSLRKAQVRRRTTSLKRISPANFSKEARLQVPEVVLQEILSLNSLDVELYKHAQDIFAQQQKHVMQKFVDAEKNTSAFNNSYGAPHWKVVSLATAVFLLLFIFVLVNARRRTSKLKLNEIVSYKIEINERVGFDYRSCTLAFCCGFCSS
ncbi:hypothetical protein HHK36_019174 [Tetracentron sinense]|uniref:Protein-tyrosine sulfotransferase n=1 Tax=Tetracentron sinense TaxID=13715 RepID=A0A834YVS1_TETSI|nr:hypothetical protein HHK36_019174 [Tetracentron sinense]